MADMICHKVYEFLMSILNIYIYIYVLKLKFIMQDPTEKHFGDVGILNKYKNNNKLETLQ